MTLATAVGRRGPTFGGATKQVPVDDKLPPDYDCLSSVIFHVGAALRQLFFGQWLFTTCKW
jgi:hypothetical protein